MNIEYHFLQKAIEDKNYVSFSYKGKCFDRVKPLSLLGKLLKSNNSSFETDEIKKLIISKERF
ncbi:MAG: hypothetical protein ACNI25_15505 [Halarcobacter sp.]